jgi:hypothetical protein
MTATPTASNTPAGASALPGSTRFGRVVRRAGDMFGIDLASLFDDDAEGEEGTSGFEGFTPEFAIRSQRIGRSPSTLRYKAPLTQPGEAIFKLAESVPSAISIDNQVNAPSTSNATAAPTTPAQDYSAIFGGLSQQISDLQRALNEQTQTSVTTDTSGGQQDQGQQDQGQQDQGQQDQGQPAPTYSSFVGGDPNKGGIQSVSSALAAGITPSQIRTQANQANISFTPAAATQVARATNIQQFNREGPAMGAAAVNRALQSGLRPGEVKKAAEAQGINLTQKALQQIKKDRK